MTEVKNRIKYYREKSNMTQKDLAERLGTTERNIRRWENGESMPDVYVGLRISAIFNVKIKDIFMV